MAGIMTGAAEIMRVGISGCPVMGTPLGYLGLASETRHGESEGASIPRLGFFVSNIKGTASQA